MSISVVLGAQWGDEGKGKLVDILCPSNSLIARCQGGNNAGHTIKVGGTTYDFHMLPSGLLNKDAKNLIGSGCVVHLPGLFGEIEALERKGVQGIRERLYISERCHVVLDLHQRVDGIEESELNRTGANGTGHAGGKKIGTTGKGIGPTYSTKASRSGLRIAELFRDELLETKVCSLAEGFQKRFGAEALTGYNVEDELRQLRHYRTQLAPMVIDQLPLLETAQKSKTNILVEGANAIMLDLDAGTYPYVTSSSTGLGGVFTGLGGVSPRNIVNVFGVVKAYTTRVGGGPFPTEDLADIGNQLQEVGREFGVTTGRRRRCGWLDMVVVRYSALINSYTALNLTKLDVLDDFDEIQVAVAYKDRETGEEIDGFPADVQRLEQCDVVYKKFPGWKQSIADIRRWDDLPATCREYVEFIEKFAGVPVRWIGVGPDREAMIER